MREVAVARVAWQRCLQPAAREGIVADSNNNAVCSLAHAAGTIKFRRVEK